MPSFLERFSLRLLRMLPGLIGFVIVVTWFAGGLWLMDFVFRGLKTFGVIYLIIGGILPIVWALGFGATSLFLTPWLVENKIPSSRWYLRLEKNLRKRPRVRMA
jgi:hypothetical protein